MTPDRENGRPARTTTQVDFTTTEWSVVLNAAGKDDSESRDALATLCGRYWYPVYAEIRRTVRDADALLPEASVAVYSTL